MFLLGFLVTYLYNCVVENNNLYSLVGYLCLFSLSLFMVRVEYTFFIRYLVWSVLLFKILNLYNKSEKK